MPEPVPLLVFSDDWGRHPSSCQHLFRVISTRRAVTWINTIGLRPPRFDRATVTRGHEKLGSWLTHNASGVNGSALRVLNPVMWPSFRSRLARWINHRILARAAKPASRLEPDPIVVTTLPLLPGLVGRVRASRWVYYCVDDYSHWPGLAGETLRRLERELVERVDLAIAAGESLQSHLASLGKPSVLLTHGVDLGFWRKPGIPLGMPSLPEPLVVFWGLIDRRMDRELIEVLSRRMNGGTILLVGPQDCPDAGMLSLPRVRMLSAMPFEALPALAARASVLIAPYADIPVTRAMEPLKLKEYLATDKPVVVRKLPATVPWADCADVVDSPESFASTALERVRTGLPETQRQARQRLEAESWAAKAAQFEGWLDAE